MKTLAGLLLTICGVLIILGIFMPGNQIISPDVDKVLWPASVLGLGWSIAIVTGLGWRIVPTFVGIVALALLALSTLNPALRIFGWADGVIYAAIAAVCLYVVINTRRKAAAANP